MRISNAISAGEAESLIDDVFNPVIYTVCPDSGIKSEKNSSADTKENPMGKRKDGLKKNRDLF